MESQTLWYDENKDIHFLVNNQTGQAQQVTKTGEYVQNFSLKLTGKVGYQDRIQIAKGDPGLMPYQIDCLKFHPNSALYTPQNDQFEGYSQFAQPKTQPYYNQESYIKNNREQKRFIEEIQKKINLKNEKNGTLFDYPGLQKSNIGVHFLTGTVIDKQRVQKTNVIPSYAEQKLEIKRLRRDPDRNQSVQIINQRSLPYPNINFLEQSVISVGNNGNYTTVNAGSRMDTAPFATRNMKNSMMLNENSEKKDRKSNKSSENGSSLQDDRVNLSRYSQKISTSSNITVPFNMTNVTELDRFNSFSKLDGNYSSNISQMSAKIELFKSNTFDKTINLLDNKQSQIDLKPFAKTTDLYQQKIKEKQREIEGLVIPEVKEKTTVATKGRYRGTVPSTKHQYEGDRKTIVQNFPEFYESQKLNPKKEEMQKNRRQLLQQVISEMLIQNEKNQI